ncbi:dihydrodipicolinate synthase family protein [Mycolicibacterium wolinskyi]|uniref:dihydrodipicolinate synthase family protein n=1 Tax=Mycolicibacterium wolinskyi TaxID=59750 RepID=UPI00391779B4
MTVISLIDEAGTLTTHELRDYDFSQPDSAAPTSRIAYAAAHVVPRLTGNNVPGAPADIDWDATMQFRHHLWSWHLGVADAMDTAQRNMGFDAVAVRELIRRSAAEAQFVGGALVVGINTDHVATTYISLDEVIGSYVEQLHYAEDVGAEVVMMASRHLARVADGTADYRRVYDAVLSRAGRPVILHWLGTPFDPALAGYFGSDDSAAARATVRAIIEDNIDQVAGIKVSLLDGTTEIALRRELPDSVRVFTGDDYNYVDLIAGDATGHCDALLGAFATCAPIASAALSALDKGDERAFRALLEPTQALARHVFATPTEYYKTGVAFLSWLNGHQPAFAMVSGLHSARSLPHLSRLVQLADAAGALEHPELAAQRWTDLLTVYGVRSTVRS